MPSAPWALLRVGLCCVTCISQKNQDVWAGTGWRLQPEVIKGRSRISSASAHLSGAFLKECFEKSITDGKKKTNMLRLHTNKSSEVGSIGEEAGRTWYSQGWAGALVGVAGWLWRVPACWRATWSAAEWVSDWAGCRLLRLSQISGAVFAPILGGAGPNLDECQACAFSAIISKSEDVQAGSV